MTTQLHTDNTVFNRLRRDHGKAVADFNMIEAGDKIMVCLSGGKDSYTLLELLLHSQRVAPIDFDIVAVNLDQKQPGFPEHVLPTYLSDKNVDFEIVQEDTYSIVTDKIPEGKTTCGLCSRLRRGILYKTATRLGATKIALGQHVVIRPMAYCREKDIEAYSLQQQHPIIPCNLCGSQPNLQRGEMKKLLHSWETENPSKIASMLTAIKNVTPSHLLDTSLYNFDDNNQEVKKASEFLGVPIKPINISVTN